MKTILIILLTVSFSYLNAKTTELKNENKKLEQEIAFKKELNKKKARQEKLKIEIEKLKEVLYKDNQEKRFN